MPSLYIHEKYNVRAYPAHDISAESNFIANIRNNIANTVMRKVLLPTSILIILSNDILDDAVFTIECMDGLLRWLLDEIVEIIKFQKRCLPPKSTRFEEPRVYLLKALPKPGKINFPTLFRGVRRKFNSNLQNMLENYHGFGFINIHEITTRPQDERFFISNQSGKLSDEGIIQLWTSISQTFKAMDDKLKAPTMIANKATQTLTNHQVQDKHQTVTPGNPPRNTPRDYRSPRRENVTPRRDTRSPRSWERGFSSRHRNPHFYSAPQRRNTPPHSARSLQRDNNFKH